MPFFYSVAYYAITRQNDFVCIFVDIDDYIIANHNDAVLEVKHADSWAIKSPAVNKSHIIRVDDICGHTAGERFIFNKHNFIQVNHVFRFPAEHIVQRAACRYQHLSWKKRFTVWFYIFYIREHKIWEMKRIYTRTNIDFLYIWKLFHTFFQQKLHCIFAIRADKQSFLNSWFNINITDKKILAAAKCMQR